MVRQQQLTHSVPRLCCVRVVETRTCASPNPWPSWVVSHGRELPARLEALVRAPGTRHA
jgi:hypothetical protein